MDAAFDGKRRTEAHAATLTFPPSAPVPLSRYVPGVVLSGKYRLEAVLGEGGMGAVWRASNVLLDLPVAIKLIRPELDRSSLRARLQVEARAAAKLGHPAIVRVYDVGENEFGDPFIVMELVHGETLAAMISQGRLSAVLAVQLLLPVIDALAMTHARGIVHRDLKPDNLMIAREEQRVQPKILDFGIAKLTDPRDRDHKLTEVGMVVGSPDYMSPEQARGLDDIDAGSDIWAICVVLYEAVTGNVPFSASNYNALLRAIVEDDPTSLIEQAAGDSSLWEIVKRGLSKERQRRWASMAELGQALASWLVSHGVYEDACGSALESKWLGRRDVTSGAAVPDSSRPTGAAREPQLSRDSDSNGTGLDSPPFTATIPASGAGRRRTAGAALLACALLGALLFGLNRSRVPSSDSRLNPAAAAVAHNPTAAHQEGLAPVPLVQPSASAILEPEPAPVSPPKAPHAVPRSARVTPRHEPRPDSVSDALPRSHTPLAAPPAATSAERPLDLLTPY